MLSVEGETLLIRATVTMLRSRDVIQKGPALIECMIDVPVSVIFPVLKKKELLFTHLCECVCVYICIYI